MWLQKIVARRRRDERGSASIEMTLLAPVLIVILLFVVGLGRMAHTRQQLESVASDAARAASLERNTAASAGAAHAAAKASLGDAGVSCVGLDVDVDLSSYQPGGRVSVTVVCSTKLSDVAMVGFPGRKRFTADATVPIETYRGS
ncbi:TadE/TadG family type IV pilus assembly protein [Nocardioides sp. NPDC057764]|uniref:TadE/TadG family type IV pilus assembly protein n=1 Tax=Nocardioides sp. NPDC057764 TaxID=3346243 RepID=UPI00366B70C0